MSSGCEVVVQCCERAREGALCLMGFWQARIFEFAVHSVVMCAVRGFLDDARRFVCLFSFLACDPDFTLHTPGAHSFAPWRRCGDSHNVISHWLLGTTTQSPITLCDTFQLESHRVVTTITFEDLLGLPFNQHKA